MTLSDLEGAAGEDNDLQKGYRAHVAEYLGYLCGIVRRITVLDAVYFGLIEKQRRNILHVAS